MERRVIRVEVTKEDIDAGLRIDCWSCPIAIAASRALGKELRVYETVMCDCNYAYELPNKAMDFVTRFDLGLMVAPFTFEAECLT